VTAARGRKPEALGPTSPIPDKLYFKIGEVSKLVGVQAHVLRYWQSEIAAIRPSKSASNQRRYRYKDVEIFREIRRLLYEERYTLAGARRRILSREDTPAAEAGAAASEKRAAALSPPATSGPAVPLPLPLPLALTVPASISAPVPAPTGTSIPSPAGGPASPQAGGGGALVPLPRPAAAAAVRIKTETPVAAPSASPAVSGSAWDEELSQRLRRGLKELIRLAGEEP
jgi:DNA-binding transcriptional MerR regulator